MADEKDEYRALSVTVTARQREWLIARQQRLGIPISRSVRDALENTYPEVSDERPTQVPATTTAE